MPDAAYPVLEEGWLVELRGRVGVFVARQERVAASHGREKARHHDSVPGLHLSERLR